MTLRMRRHLVFQSNGCLRVYCLFRPRAIFNKAQIELLDTMASIESDDELMVLKHTISEFFASRADEEMERLWQSGEWNEQTLQLHKQTCQLFI